MEKYIYKGKDKEAIIKSALEELQVSENEILIKVSEEKGSLFSGKKTIVEIVKIKDVADFGVSILNNILVGFNLEGNIEKQIRDTQISYRIHSNNNGILIGKNGKILNSIQKYLKQSIYSQIGLNINILLDIENYKEKQNYYLERDVKKIAKQVLKTKMEVKLDPMNSFQRRIVHNALSKFKNISSDSVGVEPNRCVVIKYKEND